MPLQNQIKNIMQRRSALKNITAAMSTLVSLPTWAAGWTPQSIGKSNLLHANEGALLAEIVETILPETSTPGAKSLKVNEFALRMIKDCYNEQAQKNLVNGLTTTETVAQKTFSKSFASLDNTQRLSVLKQMSESTDADTKQFVNMIKNLTIQGYTNSEYYLVNVQKYVMAPGFYHGCVPVKK